MIRVSKQQGKNGFIAGMEEDYGSYTFAGGTPLCSLVRAGGYTLTNTLTHTGSAATTENIFTFEGSVEVVELFGVCTAVGDATTFSGVKFEIDDGTAQSDLTTGVDASGIVSGGLLLKEDDETNPLVFSNPTAATVISATSKRVHEPAIIQQKTGGVTSYIRVSYTGDASTDITIEYHIRWVPINGDSAVTAV